MRQHFFYVPHLSTCERSTHAATGGYWLARQARIKRARHCRHMTGVMASTCFMKNAIININTGTLHRLYKTQSSKFRTLLIKLLGHHIHCLTHWKQKQKGKGKALPLNKFSIWKSTRGAYKVQLNWTNLSLPTKGWLLMGKCDGPVSYKREARNWPA